MPNTELTLKSVAEEINTLLGSSSLEVELTTADIRTSLKQAVRVYNRHRPQRRNVALGISQSVKKYHIDHARLLGVVAVRFLGPTSEYGGLFDPLTWDNMTGLPVTSDMYGEVMQRYHYLEMARQVVSGLPDWHAQWEDDGRFYLYIALTGAASPIITSGVAVAATGQVTFSDNGLTDGDTVSMNDGQGSTVVFEFDNNAAVTAGNTSVQIGADLAATCNNFADAVNASTLYIRATAYASRVVLTHNLPGSQGNNAILSESEAGAKITLTAFSGGSDGGGAQYLCSYEYTWGVTPDDDAATGLPWIPEGDVDWIINYTCAHVKTILARIAGGKFAGIPSPDGGTLQTDSDNLRQEGRDDLKELADEIKRRRRPLPPEIG